MKIMRILLPTALAASITAPAFSATIVAQSSGLAAPDQTVGFEEVDLNTGDTVTNQFAGLGVTFTPGITYFDNVSPRPNFSGAAALSFSGSDFSIIFSDAVSDFAANITANFGSFTATALLNGSNVETFSHTFPLNTVPSNVNNFFGFADSTFDEVTFVLNGNTSAALDNVSYNVAAVPLPASLPFLVAGLGAFGVMRKRQKRKAT